MSWWRRVLGFEQPEKREVKFSPELSAYLANRGAGQLSGAGVAVNQESAMRFMAVFACVRVISEDIAALPLRIYRRLRPRGQEEAMNHRLYDLLHSQPNPEQNSMEWREMLQAHLLLWGNAYCEIVRENGWPTQLWPISPYRVSIRRNSTTQQLEYMVTPPGGDSTQRRFAGRDIFHIKGLSLNGVTGISPIAYGKDAIGGGLAGQEFANAFFRQGAHPGGTIEYPGLLSEEGHNRLKSDFEEKAAGLSNAQRWILLEEGAKANTLIGMPLEDAQFIEQRRFSVEEIARLFRIQPHMISDLQRATFNNVEELTRSHAKFTLVPWAVRWQHAINTRLIPEEEQRTFFSKIVMQGLLQGDPEERSKFYKALWEMGVLSPNDIRDLEDMNPIDDGDTYYVPKNFGEVGAEPEPEPIITPSNGRKPAPVGA